MEPELFGPYRLDGLLGRGGMGEVHRAFDTVKKRTVALKRLRRELADDEDFQRRFRRESEHAARLSDPHVIPIHDYGEIDGILFLDMRFVRGTDFATLLREHHPLPAPRVVHLIAQVASALDAAHAEGLIHRDVKPSNALTTGEEHDDFVYLVDFGIVASVTPGTTSLTLAGTTVGTLEYMAPERFGDGPTDHHVDIYALGCMLHEMLTGARPFPSNSVGALLNAHLNAPPPRPSVGRADLPAGLDDVVGRAMAKDPTDRYATAGALARAARAALAAPPAETLGPPPDRARRPSAPGPGRDPDGPAPSSAGSRSGAPSSGAPLSGAPPSGAPPSGARPRPGSGPRPAGAPAQVRTPPPAPFRGSPTSGPRSFVPRPPGTPPPGRPPTGGAPSAGGPPRETPDTGPRTGLRGWLARHRQPVLIATGLVLAVLLTFGAVTWSWVHQQYYVGASDGNVAVFQGVQGSFLGVPLQSEVVRSNVALTDLPPATRLEVEEGIVITDGGLTGAYMRVDQLRNEMLPLCPAGGSTQDATPGVTCRVVS